MRVTQVTVEQEPRMDTTSAIETIPELPELTDDELAQVIGGKGIVSDVLTTVYRRVGTCGCGVAH